MAKIMRTKNLKIQMLAGNSLKICVGAGFEISSTLVMDWVLPKTRVLEVCHEEKMVLRHDEQGIYIILYFGIFA